MESNRGSNGKKIPLFPFLKDNETKNKQHRVNLLSSTILMISAKIISIYFFLQKLLQNFIIGKSTISSEEMRKNELQTKNI